MTLRWFGSGARAVLLAGLWGCSSSTVEPVEALDEDSQALGTLTNWGQSRNTARHNAFNPYETELVRANIDDIHQVWRTNFPTQSIIQHGQSLFLISRDASAASLDARNGSLRWRADDFIYGTLAHDGKYVFSTGDNRSVGYAAATGALVHEFPPPAFDFSTSNPVTRDALTFTTYYGGEPGVLNGKLQAYRAQTKTVAYTVPLLEQTSRNPAVSNGRVIVSGESTTQSFSAETGVSGWIAPVGCDVSRGPVVFSGRIFLSSGSTVVALNEKTGAELWRTTVASPIVGALAVNQSHIFVPTAAESGVTVRALSPNGGVDFSATVGSGTLSGDLAVAGDLLWLGENDGRLYALAAEDASLLRSFELSAGGPRFVSGPIIANGQLYVTNTAGVFAFGLGPVVVPEVVDGDGASGPVADVSDDGNQISFVSAATNLIANDTNASADVFTFDRTTRTTTRVCTEIPAGSFVDASRGTSHVLLWSSAPLVAGDTDGKHDLFVRDCSTGLTQIVSNNANGTPSTGNVTRGDMSSDGRFVTFIAASALVPADTNTVPDAYIYDRQTGVTELVSLGSGGQLVDREVVRPSVSDDGRYVAFHTTSAALIPGETDTRNDVFVRDRLLATIEKVSVSSSGVAGNGNSSSAKISADGRYVAFWSLAKNFGFNDSRIRIYVRDRVNQTTQAVNPAGIVSSSAEDPPTFSQDARFVLFTTSASTPGAAIYLADRQAGTVEAVSLTQSGVPALGFSPRVSVDGTVVAFTSSVDTFVPNDLNLASDVFTRDRTTTTTERVSLGLP